MKFVRKQRLPVSRSLWGYGFGLGKMGEDGRVCMYVFTKVRRLLNLSCWSQIRREKENPYLGVEKHSCELETWFANDWRPLLVMAVIISGSLCVPCLAAVEP